MGLRVPEAVSSSSGDAPRGIDEAHARMPASPRPIQALREGDARCAGCASCGHRSRQKSSSSSSKTDCGSAATKDERGEYDLGADVDGLSELRQLWEQYGVQTSCGTRLVRDDRRAVGGEARTSSMRQPQAKHQFKSTASMAGYGDGEDEGDSVDGGRGLRESRLRKGRSGMIISSLDEHTRPAPSGQIPSQIPAFNYFRVSGSSPVLGRLQTLVTDGHSKSQIRRIWSVLVPDVH